MTMKIAVIGAGHMGSYHARVVNSNPRASLEMVIDPREEVGRKVAESFGAKWYPSFPKSADVDAVIIAAATEAHKEIALDVIEQGKHLLIEKPIAPNFQDVIEITNAAEDKRVVLICGLLERFNPAIITAKSLISSPLHITTTRHSPYAPRIKTGVAWDLLIHDVDLVIDIFGSAPSEVAGIKAFPLSDRKNQSEDIIEAIMDFEGKGVSHSSASRIGQRKIRSMSVYESDRLIEIDLLRKDVTIYHNVLEQDIENGRGYKQQAVIEIPELITNLEPLAAQFSFFLESIDSPKNFNQDYNLAHSVISQLVAFNDK
jgi:predicted dehydrogenase